MILFDKENDRRQSSFGEYTHDRRKQTKMDRRTHPLLDEELIEMIAERASEKAILKMENIIYKNVGKSFINKLVYLIGVCIVGLAYFLNSHGFLDFKR
ncbi:hypothetical protein [Caudoviricetes sp.]|nr:hypothetical protein [Caudoviricetes sp.]